MRSTKQYFVSFFCCCCGGDFQHEIVECGLDAKFDDETGAPCIVKVLDPISPNIRTEREAHNGKTSTIHFYLLIRCGIGSYGNERSRSFTVRSRSVHGPPACAPLKCIHRWIINDKSFWIPLFRFPRLFRQTQFKEVSLNHFNRHVLKKHGKHRSSATMSHTKAFTWLLTYSPLAVTESQRRWIRSSSSQLPH